MLYLYICIGSPIAEKMKLLKLSPIIIIIIIAKTSSAVIETKKKYA